MTARTSRAVRRLWLRTEQALLGEILHLAAVPKTADPVRQVIGWGLQPDDFDRPYHRQVYDAMRRLAARGERAHPQAVWQELCRDPQVPDHLAARGVLLTDLMGAAGGRGSLPSAAVMVLETSTRRTVGIWAARLYQTARFTEATATLAQARRLRAEVATWLRRWRLMPEAASRQLAAGPAAPDRAVPLAAATRNRRREPPGIEVALLASIATYPDRLQAIRIWLRPGHLSLAGPATCIRSRSTNTLKAAAWIR